jgi:hypothetical protein
LRRHRVGYARHGATAWCSGPLGMGMG